VLDTETTGLEPAHGHRIIELAILELKDREPTGRTWQWYFNPMRGVDPGAERIHGLSQEFLAGQPRFHEVSDTILDVLGDGDKLIIHNAPFDVGFLNAEFGRLPFYPLIGMDRVIDTLELARSRYPGKKNGLDALALRFNVTTQRRKLHSAMGDVEILAKVYFYLTLERQTAFDLAFMPIEHPGCRPAQLPPRITAAEIADHEEFIAGFEKPAFWLAMR
jgi:DNA polymerase-3 subunit epsilon